MLIRRVLKCFFFVAVTSAILSIQFLYFNDPDIKNDLNLMEVSLVEIETETNLTSYRRAILVHEANARKFSEIFDHFLFNSWLYTLRVQHEYRNKYKLDRIIASNIIDIIITIPVPYIQKLPTQCQFVDNMKKEQLPYIHSRTRTKSLCLVLNGTNSLHSDKEYINILHNTYKFLNSIDCIVSFEENYPDLYYSYDYILKTDDDVFITPFFLYQLPLNSSEFIAGLGGYSWHNETILQLLNMSNILNLKHCVEPRDYCFNIGATWYAAPDLIINVAKLTIEVNRYLLWLFDTKQTHYTRWADGWYRPVTSMYASDLAINHLIIHNESLIFKTHRYNEDYLLMDVETQRKAKINRNNKIIHLHVWQRGGYFGKMRWKTEMREYLGDIVSFLNEKQYEMEIRSYALSIAFDLHLNLSLHIFNIDELLLEKRYIDEGQFNRTVNKQIYTEYHRELKACNVTGDLAGSDIMLKEEHTYLILYDVISWEQCRLLCVMNVNNTEVNEKKCKGWTWNKWSHTCYPKMRFDVEILNEDRPALISGPANCTLSAS